jgi:hypothetical protein
MQFHIWLLHGYAGSGKDATGDILKGLVEEPAMASFAGAVKDEVAVMYELERSILDTQEGKQKWLAFADGTRKQVRTLLIEHGEGQKEVYKNRGIWADRVQKPEICRNWIFTDWRFMAELETLRKRFPEAKIHTVRIVRSSVIPTDSPTEHELDTFPSEFVIDNSGSRLWIATQLQKIIEYTQTRMTGSA